MGTDKGVKLDTGKLRWDLLPLDLVEGIVEVLTFGANKYTDNGWQSVENGYDRYKAAFFRHLLEIEKGNLIDTESGLSHSDHMLTNALFMSYMVKDEIATLSHGAEHEYQGWGGDSV